MKQSAKWLGACFFGPVRASLPRTVIRSRMSTKISFFLLERESFCVGPTCRVGASAVLSRARLQPVRRRNGRFSAGERALDRSTPGSRRVREFGGFDPSRFLASRGEVPLSKGGKWVPGLLDQGFLGTQILAPRIGRGVATSAQTTPGVPRHLALRRRGAGSDERYECSRAQQQEQALCLGPSGTADDSHQLSPGRRSATVSSQEVEPQKFKVRGSHPRIIAYVTCQGLDPFVQIAFLTTGSEGGKP